MVPVCSHRALFKAIAITVVSGVAFSQTASAFFDDPYITRVEEDWVALIRVPDEPTCAPQIINVISPIPSLGSAFGMIELNHASFPGFQEGGLQVQSWVGETRSSVAYSTEHKKLSHDFDRLEYTVAMERSGETLTFELLNGRSQTWGRFAQTPLQAQVNVGDPSLSQYDPAYSVANTNVNVGAHRVDVLYLRETRYHMSDDSIITDGTMRVIHRYSALVQDVSLEEYDSNPDYYNIGIDE